jgi:hypothetical protein
MSIFKTIGKIGKGILGTVAPTLAGALPGPLGDLARKAVTDLLGLEQESTEDQIEKALVAANPEMLERLRKLDADFKLQMKKLDIDLEGVYATDRASARAREIALRDWTPKVLAVIIVGGYAFVQYFLLTRVLPVDSREIIMRSLGTMDMALGMMLAYYFGSSSSSARKTEIMNGGSK